MRKKYLFIALIAIFLIPFIVNAETCDVDKISINSIIVEEKAKNVTELGETIASGKNINLNLGMIEVGDNIKYRIVVKNDSAEDYELDKKSFNINSDYIDYSIESEDDSYIVKGNSSKVMFINVQYKNKVPDSAFQSGTFNENKRITVNLSSGNGLLNPDTWFNLYTLIIALLVVIGITIYMLTRKKKSVKHMVLIIGVLLLVPIGVNALCKCEITINSNVVINQIDECKYKAVTNYGSFSLTEDIKETCISTYDEDYVFGHKLFDVVEQDNPLIEEDPETSMTYLYVGDVGPVDFKSNSYIKIYEDESKQTLIKTLTKDDFNYEERYSISRLLYTSDYDYNDIVIPLGVYNYRNIYIEASDDLISITQGYQCSENIEPNYYDKCGSLRYTLVRDTRYGKVVITDDNIEGPWVAGSSTFEKLQNLNETLRIEAYNRGQDYRTLVSQEGNIFYINTEFYTFEVR